MEIKVTVTHELSEKTLQFLASLAGAKITGSTETPVVSLPKKEKTEKAEKPKAEKADTAASNGSAAETALDLPTIKAKVIALRDAGKKDKTLEIMSAYKITKLSDLPEDKYPEFMDKLNAVK